MNPVSLANRLEVNKVEKPTKDDLAEIVSVFGDMRDEDFDEWWLRNQGMVEGLDISDIPSGDLHSLAERIREWKRKKSN